MADTICLDWENHGQTLTEKPLFIGQLIVDTCYNGHVSPRVWFKINLSIAEISVIHSTPGMLLSQGFS